ncbi:uncharacterized protein LOC62_04G005277 [Vanrija pseudolonga]|uniref:Uncharacterized protein n=1 Tax=Vanrija pseudolonga TaxID=143232 RepID=A0AAF0YBM8_9TREE|nr:hypothetical protein LOC62_04G005277 [Vanrija pseudolonga]
MPRLPRKVKILDLEPCEGQEADDFSAYDYIYRGDFPRKQKHTRWTARDGIYSDYAPLILRRHGLAVREDWGRVLDTTVDFLRLDTYPGVADDVTVPLATPRYVLHLHWPPPSLFNDHFSFSFIGSQVCGRTPDVRDVKLVFSPNCTPPLPEDVLGIIISATTVFRSAMVKGSTAFTVVGLERWIPGVDAAEFKRSLRARGVGKYGYYGSPSDEDSGRAYDSIQYLTLEEWWDSLGDMIKVVGLWHGQYPAQAGRAWRAYPHILERIIAYAPSVSALIAWRRTCRRYRSVADERLFAHAILRRRNPPPPGKWGALECIVRPKPGSNALPFYNARRNGFELVLPPTSGLLADRNLPFYPWKAHTIDVAHHGEYAQASFARHGDWDSATMTEGGQEYRPHVLRRFGSCTADWWDVVHDTTVDYVTIGQDQGEGDYTVTMPFSTARYILHLACPP